MQARHLRAEPLVRSEYEVHDLSPFNSRASLSHGPLMFDALQQMSDYEPDYDDRSRDAEEPCNRVTHFALPPPFDSSIHNESTERMTKQEARQSIKQFNRDDLG